MLPGLPPKLKTLTSYHKHLNLIFEYIYIWEKALYGYKVQPCLCQKGKIANYVRAKS